MKTRQPYMRAILPTVSYSNALNMGDKKETIQQILVIDKKTERTIVDARFYMARSADGASPVYCSMWVHGSIHTSGRGTAGGWGYHKQSVALASAIRSAGIELYGSPYGHPVNSDTPAQTRKLLKTHAHIGGHGSGSMTCALLAIAYAAGCRDAIVVGA